MGVNTQYGDLESAYAAIGEAAAYIASAMKDGNKAAPGIKTALGALDSLIVDELDRLEDLID